MLREDGQLAKKVLNDNTLLIYPALPAKLREYQELVVKGFFLSNTGRQAGGEPGGAAWRRTATSTSTKAQPGW